MTLEQYPTTPAQSALMAQYELNPLDDAFDLSFVFRMEGALDTSRLARALRKALAAPGFNTTFHRSGACVTARLHAPAPDVRIVPVPAADPQAWVLAEVEADRAGGRIDPDDPHQIRVRIHEAGELTFVYLRASHLVGDAYTFYQLTALTSHLYDAPDDTWDLLAAQATQSHPGTVRPVTPAPSAVERYTTQMRSVDTVTHRVLAGVRVDGRIRGASTFVRVEGGDAQRLRTSAAVTTFGAASTFFAAYAAVLQRLEGTDHVTIGVPLANRAGREAKTALGYFVNTLPLPVHVRDGATWLELCEQVGAGVRLLQACQGLNPGAAEVRGAFPSGGWAPDNAVTFYKQGLHLNITGVETTSLHLDRPSLTYPLTVNVADLGDAYELEVCAADSLDGIDVVGLLRQALEHIAGSPDRAVLAGGIVRSGGQCVPVDTPARSESLVDLLEASCAKYADRVAVQDGTQALTYAQLWRSALDTAAWLDEEQATPYVVVRATRSVEAVSAIVGVLASGRTYVPIDPDGSARREALICTRIAAAQGAEPTRLRGPMSPTRAAGMASARPDAEHPAYVIFTSGSTGEPKGVVVPHGNVVDLLHSTTDRFGLTGDDTWCLFHSLAFDFSVWEMFGALTTGARLVIADRLDVQDPVATAGWLRRNQVTVLNQTPSAFRRLTPVFEQGAVLPDVRLLIFGGEALFPADLQTWWRESPECRVVNMYGITETTVHVTARDMTPADLTRSDSPIGEALDHLELHVLDRWGRPCPNGIQGELHVGGSGVAREYLGRPDLTEQRFVQLRHGDAWQRAYRTGDLARRMPDGELVYEGRCDDQVQLRGYRIELGEVEAALRTVTGVDQAVVTLESPGGAEPFLAAWFCGGASTDDARAALKRSLPSYMQPGRWTRLDSFPTNQNGKPDMAALRAAAESPVTAKTPGEAPALALGIAEIWEDVIRSGPVGVDAQFLEVGGSSMHVLAIHERISRQMPTTRFNVVDLYEYSTPRALAEHLLELSTSTPTMKASQS